MKSKFQGYSESQHKVKHPQVAFPLAINRRRWLSSCKKKPWPEDCVEAAHVSKSNESRTRTTGPKPHLSLEPHLISQSIASGSSLILASQAVSLTMLPSYPHMIRS